MLHINALNPSNFTPPHHLHLPDALRERCAADKILPHHRLNLLLGACEKRKRSCVRLLRSHSFKVSDKQQPSARAKGDFFFGHVCSLTKSGTDVESAHRLCPNMCPSSGSKPNPGSLAEAGKLFLKHTTLHGLRHIFLSGSYPRRVAWLLAFLAAVALLFTWSSNRVRYLLSSPVYTKAHMVYAKRLVFPAVTICNQNLLLPRRMKKTDIFSAGRWLELLGVDLEVSPAAKEALVTLRGEGGGGGGGGGGGSAGTEPPWSSLSRILDFKHFLPPPRESQPSMRQLLDRLGHQLEEMLLYCRYQGEQCGPRNFSTVSFSSNFPLFSPSALMSSLLSLSDQVKFVVITCQNLRWAQLYIYHQPH